MKKIISLFLSVFIMFGAIFCVPFKDNKLVTTANAANTVYYGIFELDLSGDGTYYELERVSEFASGEVVIPSTYQGLPVKSMSGYAFRDCTEVTSVVIPGTFTYIRSQAFCRNEHIKKVTISEGTTEIGDRVFEDCINLEVLILPEGITHIGSNILDGTKIFKNEDVWEDDVIYMGNYLVGSRTSKKESMAIKEGTTVICSNAFDFWENTKEFSIPSTVKYIGNQSFAYCTALESIVIPDSVEVMGTYVFTHCKNLKSIKLSSNVKNIDHYTFSYCQSLDNVQIPYGVETISAYAFQDCTSLSNITIPDSVNSMFSSTFSTTPLYKNEENWDNNALYIDNHLVAVKISKIDDAFEVRPGTVHIAGQAFEYCKKLNAITVPASVKTISQSAFRECNNLDFFFYEGTASQLSEIDFANNDKFLNDTVCIIGADRTKKPACPTVKSVTNVADGVQISWNAVPGAEMYLVYRRGAGTNEWVCLGYTENATTVIDTKATHNQYWRYSVRAINSYGFSTFDENGKYLKYVGTPYLSGISNATNGIYIKWGNVSGATGYRVYRRGAGEKYWTYITTVSTPYFTDKAVKNSDGNYYRYTVRAVVGGVYSGYQDGLYIKRLSNPTVKSVTNTNGGITVKWSAVKGTTGYYIYRKTATSGWVRVGVAKGTNTTTFIDKTAKSGTTYIYTVRAVYGSTLSYFNSGKSCKRR